MRERGVRDGDGRKGGSENKNRRWKRRKGVRTKIGDGREGKTEIEGEKKVVSM